jgi:hypothetical protein
VARPNCTNEESISKSGPPWSLGTDLQPKHLRELAIYRALAPLRAASAAASAEVQIDYWSRALVAGCGAPEVPSWQAGNFVTDPIFCPLFLVQNHLPLSLLHFWQILGCAETQRRQTAAVGGIAAVNIRALPALPARRLSYKIRLGVLR